MKYDLNKRKYIYLLMFIIILSTIAFFGLTFAYYKVRIIENKYDKSVNVTSKLLEVVYEDNMEIIVASDILPGDKFNKKFKVKNTGNGQASYSLKFDNINSTFIRSDWSYTIKDNNGSIITDGKILTNVQDGIQLIVKQVIIEPKTTHEYLLEVRYDYSDEDQSEDMGKSLDLRVNIGEPVSSVSLVNVPIDSRPITRSNFEYLVNATNYNYLEVSNGLDSNDVNGYNSGNVETVQEEVNTYLKKNSLNSIVILNLSSYMFGGLINSRNPDLYYKDIYEKNLNNLENIIEAYPNNRFYINFTIPRSYIEDRVNAYDNSNTFINDTLNYYMYSDTSLINFMYAMEQWSYIYFMKLMNPSNYNNINNGIVNNFYNGFYNKYKNDCDKYVNMYEQSIEILKSLKKISDSYDNVIVNYSLDDPTLSENVTQFESVIPSFIVRDSENNIIKYNGTNYVYESANHLFGSNHVNLSSVDDYNHVVLARELNRINNRKIIINENYSSSDLKDYVGPFDSLTLSELFVQDQKFINADVSNATTEVTINSYYAMNLSENLKKNYADSINNLGENKMIISNSYNASDIQILSDSVLQNSSVFNFASFGGWNTNANAIGTQIGRTVTYISLYNEINECINLNNCSNNSVTSDLLVRVNNYDKTRLIGVLEDSVYNILANKNIDNLASNYYYNNFLNEFFNTNFDFAGYKYNYSQVNSTINYVNPWSRNFEIKYEIVLKS